MKGRHPGAYPGPVIPAPEYRVLDAERNVIAFSHSFDAMFAAWRLLGGSLESEDFGHPAFHPETTHPNPFGAWGPPHGH